MNSAVRYQASRHPVAAFFTALLIGPFVLAAVVLVVSIYVVFATLLLLFGRKELA